MKTLIIKFLQKRKGLFDREQVVDMIESKTASRYFSQRYYRNWLKLFRNKRHKPLHALERMSLAFEPIGIKSKLKSVFKKRSFKPIKTIIIL